MQARWCRKMAIAGGVALLGAAGCGDIGDGTAGSPLLPEVGPVHTVGDSGSSTLLYCPTAIRREIKRDIGSGGGTVEIDGHSITLPPGAVDRPVEIRMRVRESNYLVVDIDASSLLNEQFLKPVQITLSYARCSDLYSTPPEVSAWYVSDDANQLLEYMGSGVDHSTFSITFYTDHLSAYALAN